MLSVVAAETPVLDRRQRRRLETIEEVLDVAAEVMAEQGVAGLSIGEVARRMGIRPPSLYVYFDSKHALYDGLFARGSRLVLETMQQATDGLIERSSSLEDALHVAAAALVRWSVENTPYSQLLFWRPVPGFEPSPDAYASAVGLVTLSRAQFTEMQARGWIRADASIEEALRDWTILTAGVVSQQLSNAPHESFETGTFTAALPSVVAMFASRYAPSSSTPAPRRRARRADQR